MTAKVLEDFGIQRFKLELKASKEAKLMEYEGGIYYGILTGLKIASLMVDFGLVFDRDVLSVLKSTRSTEEVITTLNNWHSEKGVVYEDRHILVDYSKKTGKKYFNWGVEMGFVYVFEMYEAYLEAGAKPDEAKGRMSYRIERLFHTTLRMEE